MTNYVIKKIIDTIFLFYYIFFEKTDTYYTHNLQSDYAINFVNLSLDEFKRKNKETMSPILNSFCDVNDIIIVYKIKSINYSPATVEKIASYIKNKFWGLLNAIYVDTLYLSNEEVFLSSVLNIYLIHYSKSEFGILMIKKDRNSFQVIEKYMKSCDVGKYFKRKQIIYNKTEGFLAI